MSLKESIAKNKRGSYIVEAAMVLPVFILVFTALALVTDFIGKCEAAVFEECRIIHRIDLKAPEPIPNPTGKGLRILDFGYLYSDGYMDDLISMCAGTELKAEYPFGISGKIDFRMKVLSRGFTGSLQDSGTLNESDFMDGSGSVRVVIFPKYGERFHRPGCRYVKQDYYGEEVKLEMEEKDAVMKGYTPCLICGGGDG